jgi:hypothetical protein
LLSVRRDGDLYRLNWRLNTASVYGRITWAWITVVSLVITLLLFIAANHSVIYFFKHA